MSTKIRLSVKNSAGEVLASAIGVEEVWLVYELLYSPGDYIEITLDVPEQYLILCLDDALSPAFVYCKDMSCIYPVPFGEARKVFSAHPFTGQRHYLHVRLANHDEIAARKNLALNPWATHEFCGFYPFASANVETRGEMIFAAKNAIDGLKANSFHGEWPFTSWGINQNPNAAWRIDFGRVVKLDEAIFYLRADFPHDAWWKETSLHFSDGSDLIVPLKKIATGQRISFPTKTVEWVVLDTLLKADDASPFPALTQIELWGYDIQDTQGKCR